MDCLEVQDRLPWHLNGSLEADEQEALRRHLDACPACQEQLRETKRAAAVFGAHLPARALVDVAWDRPPSGLEQETVRRHLETCSSCSQELADARESRRLEGEAERARPPAAAPAWWSGASIAAALVFGLAAGLLLGSGRRPLDTGEEARRRLEGRLAEVSSEAARLRDREAELRGRVDRLEAPQANLPIIEVQPGTGAQRSAGGSPPNEVVVPAGAPLVALVLDSATPRGGPLVVELRAGDGSLLLRVAGLQPSSLGGYTLGLPANRLPEGQVTLVASAEDGRGRATSYVLHVRKAH